MVEPETDIAKYTVCCHTSAGCKKSYGSDVIRSSCTSGHRNRKLTSLPRMWIRFVPPGMYRYKLFFLIISTFNYYLFYLFIFLAVLGLRFCARASSSCGKRGPLFITVRGPLTIVASLVAEHRLQVRRLSSCGSRAQLLRGMWDLPRPGLEPVSPALAGRFSTTAPPGKPLCTDLEQNHIYQMRYTKAK